LQILYLVMFIALSPLPAGVAVAALITIAGIDFGHLINDWCDIGSTESQQETSWRVSLLAETVCRCRRFSVGAVAAILL
jgi:hypothetical protein